ncbi:MAG TPA: ABC transporter ATP-binding protein [Polyangia bacterium]
MTTAVPDAGASAPGKTPRVASAALIVEGLTRRFTRVGAPAVNRVDFTAAAGTITTLLGPSGSGKSTVLRLIAGLEQPDEGRLLIDGVDGTAIPPQHRGVGFVFQSYALFPHMNVRDNIGFGLKVRRFGKAEIERRTDELLAAVELSGYGGRLPRELSGGQRQRVAFARALATEPRLLLLDEPFGALDAQVRVALREWLRRFHEERASDPKHRPVTTILVTHDQEEAMDLSDRIVVMNQGCVEQIGTPSEIYDHPASPFVASFVGSANLLRGRVFNGVATVGALATSMPAPDGASDGAEVHAFVRPHEVKLSKPKHDHVGDHGPVALARVERLAFVGAYVKVTVRLPDEGTLTVELGTNEFSNLGIKEGDRVMTDMQDAKIFVGDYTI